MRRMFAVVILLGISTLGFAQKASTGSPVMDALRQIEDRSADRLVQAADRMPSSKYSYRPTEAQITFGELVAHVAEHNFALCGKIGGVASDGREGPKGTAGKDVLVAELERSFKFCRSAFALLDDTKLDEELDLGRRKASRAAAVLAMASDWADHYGQAAIYLRLNGLLPPTAKPPEAKIKPAK